VTIAEDIGALLQRGEHGGQVIVQEPRPADVAHPSAVVRAVVHDRAVLGDQQRRRAVVAVQP
jgi:hypothetical protein